MTIHFTAKGIFADTEEEKLAFYDRACAGDPVIMMELELHHLKLRRMEDEESEQRQ